MTKSKKEKVVAVVPAAGLGKRFGHGKNKPLYSLLGKPLLLWVLETLQSVKEIDEIIPVLKETDIAAGAALAENNRITKVRRVVAGGRERQDSVYNAIKAIGGGADIVLIHDGARPLAGSEIFSRSISEVKGFDGVIVGVPVKDTIKEQKPAVKSRKDVIIKQTLDRSVLWAIQTPQVFYLEKIKKAYERAYSEGFYATDDAALIERYGGEVKIIEGSYSNIKITTPDDIHIAEALMSGRC